MNFASRCWHCPLVNPFTPQISLVILLTVCHTKLTMLLYMYFGEFGIVSTSNPLIDFFVNSHHFSACTYTVGRS